KAMESQRATYRRLKLSADTVPNRVWLEQTRGVLFLDSLRHKMGDQRFFELMTGYFKDHTTKAVTAASFLKTPGVSFDVPEPGDGAAYLTSDIHGRLGSSILVYGTVREAGANRYAAEQLQNRFLDYRESAIPIYKDFEVSDEALRSHDV